MKLKLATILFAASVMFSMTSCEEMTNPGEGQLPPLAGEVVLTDVLTTNGSRVSPNYVLEFELGTENATKDGSGAVLYAKVLCNAPALTAGAYTEASPAYATAGNFVTGEEGTKLYLDGKKYLVTAGTINVKVVEGNYTINAIVKLNNGENYSVSFAGKPMTWEGLPIMKKLNTVLSAQSNLANGTKSVTLNLSDGNFTAEYDAVTYQTTYTGTGNYLAVDIYSEDGYLAAGTYKPSAAGGTVNAGEYGIGWDPGDIYNIGMEFTNWGTCWWTVDGAATPQTSAEKLTTGNITVTLVEDVYTITVDNGELYAQFVGEIPAVTPPAVPADPWEFTGDILIDKAEGLSFTLTDDTANNTTSGGAALSGVTLYWVQVTDAEGNLVAELDLVTKEGASSITGEYKVTSYPDEVGEAGNGYYIDLGAMGWGEGVMSGGALIYGQDGIIYNVDAETSKIKVTENKGQTIILIKGTTNGTTIAARYTIGEPTEDGGGASGECGCDCDACQDCTGKAEGGEEEDSFNGIIMPKFIAMSPGTGMVTLYIGQANQEYSAEAYGIVGAGEYFKTDIYSADGTLAAGTYTASAVGGVVGEGEFSIGYDTTMDWGFGPMEFTNWGSCLMTKAEDGTETGIKVTDGTIDVQVDGSTYTIVVTSSTVNVKYVGPLQ